MSEPQTIDELLEASRVGMHRLDPQQTLDALRAGALVVDIRPVQQREGTGTIKGAIQIDRTVLEWRLDPASSAALTEADHDAHVVLICQQGYASSLAADTLRSLGVHRATDLAGGVDAWLQQGLPLER